MGPKRIWKSMKSFYYDFLYDFDWEEIKKDPDKMAKLSILAFGAEIMVTVLIVIGTLIFILSVLFR
ncbi:MAG: hypothetical protein HVN35_02950 [Methanobacteriaceae archaeon]|nr:hypothetical protein [Methanobacteriaceae archaeon]